jgi:hypothetical protein
MLAHVARSMGFHARVGVVAGMSLQQIAELFSNCSVVLGITGDDLGHVWWMGAGGGVMIHVRPYGYANRSGLEYNAMAARAAVAVVDVHLQPHEVEALMAIDAAMRDPGEPEPTVAPAPVAWPTRKAG